MNDPERGQCEFCNQPEHKLVYVETIDGYIAMCKKHYDIYAREKERE